MNLSSTSAKPSTQVEPPTEGVVWFPVRNRKEVTLEINRLKSESIDSLRLGIACGDFSTKKGKKWYDWLVPTLAESFDLELCFDNFSQNPDRSLIRRLTLPEIVEHFILKHGEHFTLIELWRNPACRTTEDTCENIFAEDVVFAATWAKHLGKKVSLGKIQSSDFEWITRLVSSPFLKNIEHIEVDMDGEDLWSSGAGFYERTLRSLFKAKGVKIEIRPNVKPLPNVQVSTTEIAC
ncbi:hypothetical protein J2X69_002863 [Algoriphagus sp. 4150]|uniref:hypothetical protein n=1 Tax=Algoriphagus sp. 4150 TaxID=2817756 RepID=UPI00285B7270|nr:hypothetical protein [Algoriphagus sp. 4150]MDR7130507.1 hypothetical protein [Algoriphagus sp. 4150]